MKTLKLAWCYVWYFFAESESFMLLMLVACAFMAGALVERCC